MLIVNKYKRFLCLYNATLTNLYKQCEKQKIIKYFRHDYYHYYYQLKVFVCNQCCYLDSPPVVTWSAKAVVNMFINSFSATSRHRSFQPILLSLDRSSKITPVLNPRPYRCIDCSLTVKPL